jgi:hypothetical protein
MFSDREFAGWIVAFQDRQTSDRRTGCRLFIGAVPNECRETAATEQLHVLSRVVLGVLSGYAQGWFGCCLELDAFEGAAVSHPVRPELLD